MNVGILGAGGIANLMAKTLNGMETAKAYAVAARDLHRAKDFAEKYGISQAYGSYEELYRDKNVDLIYIATPISHHFDQMKAAILQGKNILCEKAFTLNAAQAKEILALGKEKKVLVTEAIWTRYMPMRLTMDEVIAKGLIGEIKALSANLAYPVSKVERLGSLDLGGGSLLDIGVYPINFALMHFGDKIKKIETTMVPYTSGVDAAGNVNLIYDDGKIAFLQFGMTFRSDRRGIVYGDKGYIESLNINNYAGIRVYDVNDTLIASFETPPQVTGYEYEVESCRKAIEAGTLECPEMPHREIIRVMEIMDQIRKIWGLEFPGE
ncbi:Gfo/Idh/MocA family protein [Treponema primitia]|uniref:Gfo/Idh/MocA family protein n=1 Tax=Treponema primitia TaxID=88058 RepID=UPI0002555206|nr:Gfo/Idh/MocA family oxidoreductase [Treponema primitia]